MADSGKKMTAFITRCGTHQFDVMLFGLLNAPFTFQRMMDVVSQGFLFVSLYNDVFVILADLTEKHVNPIPEVLRRLCDHGRTTRLRICHFSQSKIPLPGHLISSDDARADDSRIAAIRVLPTSTTPAELRSFLGFLGYYRRNFKRLVEIVSVLQASTSKLRWNRPETWTERSVL